MDKALKEMGFDRTQAAQVERLLAMVPTENRGILLLALTVANGEGEGADMFREFAAELLH